MNDRWQLHVIDTKGFVYEAPDLSGPAEIGRQLDPGETLPSHYQVDGRWRIVIASLKENNVSRRHLEVKPVAEGRLLLTNKSNKQVIGLSSGAELAPGASVEVRLPTVVRIGSKTIRLHDVDKDDQLSSLPMATAAPGSNFNLLTNLQNSLTRNEGPGMQADQLMSWVQAFLGLLKSAAGSKDFYLEAARAVVDLVRLDSGWVLLRAGEKWQEKARHQASTTRDKSEWQPSSRMLNNVLREKRTFWQVPREGVSISDIEAVVASPILNHDGEVIGALYGDRRLTAGSHGGYRPISNLEAMLVEVLASGVAAGLARVEQEERALITRAQMEQYMTPRLAAKLADHPEFWQGRESMVSILFCDIRGFSRISERIGPAKTVDWIGEVMGDLTQCVLDHEGVLVDYTGDELMAMWGAPEDQPDHAARACQAAQAIVASIPQLSERWRAIMQEPLRVGIGINSGLAQVGNVGSRVKRKYGALGNTVNMASRVQGATKHLKTSLLITEETRKGLGHDFATRRLCQVRVFNIKEPVTLYELMATGQDRKPGLTLGYEEALAHFTKREFREACRILGRLIPEHPEDGPALILLSRAVACLVSEPNPFDPVMDLLGK